MIAAMLPRILLLTIPAWLGGCAAPDLVPAVGAAAVEAPEDMPTRLQLENGRLCCAAVAVSQGALPGAVRSAAERIVPGGDTLFLGREWGPAGDGYRVEKRYRDGAEESFRSVLLGAEGNVLERTHSVPIVKAPANVVRAAMTVGRDVRRCEIVSDAERETGWRVLVRDGLGRTHRVTLALDGALLASHRIGAAQLLVR